MSKLKHSKVAGLHIVKLIYRSALFLAVLACYVISLATPISLNHPAILTVIGITWVVYMAEMISRLFPSKLESPGCQKQFKRNFKLTEVKKPSKKDRRSVLIVGAVWIALNGAIALLHFLIPHIVSDGVLLVISMAYGVCDLICIMFFCPFQSWFMKNRCCSTCRIYNWDFAMMFTPFIFLLPTAFKSPWLAAYVLSLLGLSLIVFLRWEITHMVHPERYYEETNACVSCENCTEKLCHHKKQLKGKWRRWKARGYNVFPTKKSN